MLIQPNRSRALLIKALRVRRVLLPHVFLISVLLRLARLGPTRHLEARLLGAADILNPSRRKPPCSVGFS